MCHPAASSAGRRELICGTSPYGVDRIREAVRCAQDWTWEDLLPNRWSVDAAHFSPLEEHELRGVLDDLIWLKDRDRWENDTYPERVATLVLWIAHQVVRWPESTRLGVAWAVLILGMPDHHFELKKGQEMLILRPSPLFFETTVEQFSGLLRAAYVDTQQHRRRWLFTQLDRRRRHHETVALQRRLNGLHSVTVRHPSKPPLPGMVGRPDRRFRQKLPR